MLYTESPASWNTRYLTPNVFECPLTLRADNGQELLERANGGKTTSTESDQVYPIHDVPMRRYDKDGRIWYTP